MSQISRSLMSGKPGARIVLSAALVATALASSPSAAQPVDDPNLVVAAGDAAYDDSSTLPEVTGNALVGRTEFALTDPQRTDPFTGDGRARELAVWIWYPTADASGARATYLPPTWAELVNNMGPLMQDVSAVRPSSMADAPLEGRPPVVVLMPGLGQPVASYTALAEDLASHGYAVVGINPTGSTDVVFPDGHVVMATPQGNIDPSLLTDIPAWYAAAEVITNVWAADAEFVVRTLTASSPAIGPLDFERVAYIGHSLGGAAAFEACSLDESCAGAVDLDGTLWTEVRHNGLQAPNLVLRQAPSAVCDAFCEEATLDFANVAAAGSSQQFAIAGSKHMSFTDLGLVPSPGNIEDYRGSIEPERMILITRNLVRSFLDVHLGNAPAASFEAATAQYEELVSY